MNTPPTASLTGKVVLVTRPKQQANRLCDLIAHQGGTAVSLPTIEIAASAEAQQNNPNYWSAFDIIIFVSRNSVIWAFKTIINKASELDHANSIAMGEGSAEELAHYGVKPVLHAGPDASSETLAALSQLQAAQIKSRHILIVKGEGGRTTLQERLSERGAIVATVNVYKRTMPVYATDYLLDIWRKQQPNAVVATSNEGLRNLVKLTPVAAGGQLLNAALVGMSQRTVKLAKQLGFKNKIFIADGRSDAGLVRALYQIDNEDIK